MKRVLLMLFAVMIMSSSTAQIKKTTVRKPSKVEIVKSRAKKWFSETYVPNFFKNPSSYRFVKCIVEPQTYEQVLKNNIWYANYQIEQNERYAKSYALSPNPYREKYNNAKEAKEKAEAQLNSLSDKEKKEVLEYKIYYECYGTNSFGAKILQRFEFKADADCNIDYNSIENIDN